jgi:beta-glucanase (GH16 family)
VPAAPAGFTTTWSDDFNGAAGSALDTGAWRYDTGTGFGTGEIETMTNSTSNVYLDGSGHLVLKALHSGTDPNSGWTSGRIETQADGFGALPGGVVRIQASIQQPNLTTANGAGYWPAFWMLGSPLRVGVPWPGSGEIDAMEDINARSSEFGTLHCGVDPGGPCNEGTGIGSGERACSGCQTGYHTYAVEIDRSTSPEQIRWYLDGNNFFTVNANQVDATTWNNATHHGFFIILNVAMGGGFPGAFGGGPTGSTQSGVPMNVDYVAVYTAGSGTQTPPPSSPTPTPTGGGTGGVNAYGTIQAESANAQSGTQTETTSDTGGGQDVGWIANGDWLQFNNVNFGSTPATQFNARVASGAAGGVSGLIEVRLDSRSNAPIGSFAVANTGGWQSWRTVPANISAVTGTHTVYLTFTSGQPADFANLNWLSFGH